MDKAWKKEKLTISFLGELLLGRAALERSGQTQLSSTLEKRKRGIFI